MSDRHSLTSQRISLAQQLIVSVIGLIVFLLVHQFEMPVLEPTGRTPAAVGKVSPAEWAKAKMHSHKHFQTAKLSTGVQLGISRDKPHYVPEDGRMIFRADIQSRYELEDLHLEWILPPGAVVVSGDPSMHLRQLADLKIMPELVLELPKGQNQTVRLKLEADSPLGRISQITQYQSLLQPEIESRRTKTQLIHQNYLEQLQRKAKLSL